VPFLQPLQWTAPPTIAMLIMPYVAQQSRTVPHTRIIPPGISCLILARQSRTVPNTQAPCPVYHGIRLAAKVVNCRRTGIISPGTSCHASHG